MSLLAQTLHAWPRFSGPERRLGGLLGALLLVALVAGGITLTLRQGDEAPPPAAATDASPAIQELTAFRQHWMALTYQDQRAVLGQMRAQLDEARQRGDAHAAWLLLAWLVRTTSVFDVEAAKALHAQAEADIGRARAAGDRIATFELALMVEAMGVQQFGRSPDPQRLQLLQQLAADIGGPLHRGLVLKLRGMLASQAGEEGEALFHYERALGLFSGKLERAEVQVLMAIALIDNPTPSASHLAIAYLDEVVRSFPPERYPGLLTPVIRLSLLLGRVDRPVEAVELAQRALNVAQRSGLGSELARARVARGQALLAAGDHARALADFSAAPLDALPLGYQLQALSGRALCLARGADPSAAAAIAQARSLAQAARAGAHAGLAQFHDTLSAASQALGDHAAALEDLQAAAAIRRALAVTGQERLAKARSESFAWEAQSDAFARRRPWLVAGSVLVALLIGGMAVVTRHQRRRHEQARAQAQAQQQDHAQLLAQSGTHAQQLEATCQALRKPARALALLVRSDGVPASPWDVQSRYMQEVRNCSRAFTDTIDGLLDMMRLQDGSYVPHPERFDLTALLQDLSQKFEPLAARKGLRWELRADLCGVFSDRQLLRRIVVNLLSHVVQHAERGTVTLRVVPADGTQCLEIACTDVNLPRWEGTTAPASADAGTGPATARMACELLGHALTAEQSPVFGLTLRIEMPGALPPSRVPAPQATPAVGRSVALVEDDAFSRITLMNALVDAGLEVQAYASFHELMSPAASQARGVPGVLISDLHLGDHGDATEALRELRRRPEWRDVPVLMLTGDIRDEVGALASELGVALAYKPISVRRLLERIALLRSPQPLPAGARTTTGRAVSAG